MEATGEHDEDTAIGTGRRLSLGFFVELGAFWFALSFLWAGMITIVMQTLVARMAGERKDLILGEMLALGALIATATVLVAGALSDRSRHAAGRRRPFVVVGTLLSLPFLFLLAHARSLAALLAAFCGLQLWLNVATSPYQALVPDLVPKPRQGRAAAVLGVASLLGQLGGLALCGFLVARPGGLNVITLAFCAVLVAAMAATARYVREARPVPSAAPQTGLLEAVAGAFRVEPRRYPDFFRLIASRFVVNMGFYTASEFLLYYISDTLRAPRPQETLGRLFLIATVTGLCGNVPAGLLADKMSKKRLVYISAALASLAAVMFLFAASVTAALWAGALFGAGFGAFAAVDWALATTLLPEHDAAKYMGVWHVSFTVPQVVAPLIGGVAAHVVNARLGHGQGYRADLVLVLVYFAAGVALLRGVHEKEPVG